MAAARDALMFSRARTLGSVVAAAVIGAWGAAVLAIAASRAIDGGPDASALGSSARGVIDGHIWKLFSSALPVSQFPALEIAGTAIAVGFAIRLLGTLWTFAGGLAAHVGSAVIAYAIMGLVWVISHSAAHDAVTRSDYGISAIWLGAVGLVVGALRHAAPRRAALIATVAVIACAALQPVAGWLPLAEHLLSLAIGYGVARVQEHLRSRPHNVSP